MASINELQPRQDGVDITVEIISVDQPREFQKFGKPGRVANAIIKDATGEMKLTLWNDQIDQVKKGDTVHIQKGFVNEWQGEKQLTTGKFGTLEVVESTLTLLEEKPTDASTLPAKEPEKDLIVSQEKKDLPQEKKEASEPLKEGLDDIEEEEVQ